MKHNPYLLVHLCVLLWGFTAILGKLITLHAIPLVFWRVLIVSACLWLWRPMWHQFSKFTRRDAGLSLGNGFIITLHWICFYTAIKTSNASVAAVSLALAPIFLALLEPWLLRQPFVLGNLFMGIAALPGVALVVGGIPDNMLTGFAWGTGAAFLAALFSVFNKGLAMRLPAMPLITLQMSAGTLMLGALIPLWPYFGSTFALPQSTDLSWLIVLSIACTFVPFLLMTIALRTVSAFSLQLAVNLEPIYAIALATALFDEGSELHGAFYAGMVLILAAVLGHAALQRRMSSVSSAA